MLKMFLKTTAALSCPLNTKASLSLYVCAWSPKAVCSDIWVGMRQTSLVRKADLDKKLKETVVEKAVHATGEDVTPDLSTANRHHPWDTGQTFGTAYWPFLITFRSN